MKSDHPTNRFFPFISTNFSAGSPKNFSSNHRGFFSLIAAAICTLQLSCTPLQTPFDTPEKAVRDFHKALLFSDCKTAFRKLTDDSKKLLKDKATREAAKAKGSGINDNAASMICQGDFAIYRSQELSGDDAVDVKLVSMTDDNRAVVSVGYGNQTWNTAVVKNPEGKWEIDLSELIRKAIKDAPQVGESSQEIFQNAIPSPSTESSRLPDSESQSPS